MFIAVCWSPPATPAGPSGAARTTAVVAVAITAPKPVPSSRKAAVVTSAEVSGRKPEARRVPRVSADIPATTVRRGP